MIACEFSKSHPPADGVKDILKEMDLRMGGLGAVKLALIFAGPGHGASLQSLAAGVSAAIPGGAVAACAGAGVIGGGVDEDDGRAISVMALGGDGADFASFALDKQVLSARPDGIEKSLAGMFGGKKPGAVILFSETGGTGMSEVLSAFSRVYPEVPVAGGVMNAASVGLCHMAGFGPSHKICAVGVAMTGSVGAQVMLSQGGNPLGRPYTVTRLSGAMIMELDGRPADEAADVVMGDASMADSEALHRGLFLGKLVADKPPHTAGRGDYLIRKVRMVDHRRGAVAAGPVFRKGDTVRFHMMDKSTATEDMELLFTPHRFGPPPRRRHHIHRRGPRQRALREKRGGRKTHP
ncbi:MAG: hypothetical protein HZB29_10865 [Nitrospinae bacterium]|nr:hypothetical protein [Nitrospinota bacterium]